MSKPHREEPSGDGVDIGVRALSPTINDPTTAVQVIDRLEDALLQIGDRPIADGVVSSRGHPDDVRFTFTGVTWDELVGLAFDELFDCGQGSRSVVERLGDAMRDLLDAIRPECDHLHRRPALETGLERPRREAAYPVEGSVPTVEDRSAIPAERWPSPQPRLPSRPSSRSRSTEAGHLTSTDMIDPSVKHAAQVKGATVTAVEHVDVLVVGAGISGIGAAHHLQERCPDRSYAILEGRADLGGTWDLFRYPGVRSDSDMHTLGYSFQPWTDSKAIADGPSILAYLRATAVEHGIDRHIRFGHQVSRAEWSSDDATWTVTTTRTDTGTGTGTDETDTDGERTGETVTDEEATGETVTFTCGYLFMCSGYYSYRGGHTPTFPGRERFTGKVVHPQHWPEDLDVDGQRVVIIGSGATAMTLVPALADRGAQVTMLQRSPTYVVSRPDRDALANTLRKVLPARWAYAITRWKNVRLQQLLYRKTRTDPGAVRKLLLDRVRKELGEDYDVDTHFTPRYDPWDQRLCLVPNSDLFGAIRSGKASVVTDQIETFTEDGIALTSGEELTADIIVTATGLELVTLGEVDFLVDGEPVDFSRTWTYKGLAYSDVPNLASTFGYIAASWTLRADLNSEYVCRLLDHMRATGTDVCTPRLRPSDHDMPERPWIDDFSAGYVKRTMDLLPRQGDRAPWLHTQRYDEDKKLLRKAPVDDGVMRFTRARVPAGATTP